MSNRSTRAPTAKDRSYGEKHWSRALGCRTASVSLRSIFQSKDASEIGFRFQYKVILKNEEEAAQRPISFLGFWF
jgi:hypothetical protein